MKIRTLFTVLIVSMLLVVGTAVAGPDIKPGQWKFTTKTKMHGAPGMQNMSATHVQCITQQDRVPMSQDASQECQVSDIDVKGDTVSWKMVCGGEGGQMDGTGQVTYRGDSMEGTMHLVIADSNMQITNYITGKRIGACNGQTSTATSQTSSGTQAIPSVVGETLAEDAIDVGQAAKDEAKQSTIDGVRDGVRSLFQGLFD